MAEEGVYKYLPAKMADRLRGLGVGVRKQMDAGMQGLHRSPAFGSSVEFAEYRSYVPGDPIHRIDWAVYARTDRYMIRQFHEEVNVRTYVMLDISESMAYQQVGPMRKIDYASYLAAGFMYIIAQQRDSAALVTFDNKIRKVFDPVSSFVGLKPMLQELETIEPREPGNIEQALHAMAEMVTGRCLIIVISDCLQDPKEVLRGVGHLSHDGKEVTVVHVLDPGELRLPLNGLYEIESLEGGDKMLVDITQIREKYLQRLREYLDEVRMGCTNAGADYLLADTLMDVRDVLMRRCTLQ